MMAQPGPLRRTRSGEPPARVLVVTAIEVRDLVKRYRRVVAVRDGS